MGDSIAAQNVALLEHLTQQATFNLKQFGALGDGVTNDTAACVAASAAITAAGGGRLIIPPGTYIVGEQIFAGAAGKGYSYYGQPIFKFTNCTTPIVIEGGGAIFRIAPGLKFGSFDPTTGLVYNPTMPFYNADYRADLSELFNFSGNASVSIRNLELDGNLPNLTLGGQWGDQGTQISAYGIYAYGNAAMHAENIYTHHHALDGLLIGYTGLTVNSAPTPHTLVNVRSEYNARQGLSWLGGIGITAINCDFSNQGKSVLESSPGAGVDIEIDGGSVGRHGLFLNCRFDNNAGCGMVSDGGGLAQHISFVGCRFGGYTYYSVWPNNPYFRFIDCLIIGDGTAWYGAVEGPDNVECTNCTFTMQAADSPAGVVYGGYIDFSTNFVRCNGCSFLADANTQLPWSEEVTYTNCYFNKTAGVTGTSYTKGSFLGGNNYITTGTNDFYGSLVFGSNRWTGGTALSVQTNAGYLMNTLQPTTWAVDLIGSNGSVYVVMTVSAGYEAPTAGTWVRGSIVIDVNAAASGFAGWICVVAGTPGTWKTFGAISA